MSAMARLKVYLKYKKTTYTFVLNRDKPITNFINFST